MISSRALLLCSVLAVISARASAQQADVISVEKPKAEAPKFWTPEQMMKVQRIAVAQRAALNVVHLGRHPRL